MYKAISTGLLLKNGIPVARAELNTARKVKSRAAIGAVP